MTTPWGGGSAEMDGSWAPPRTEAPAGQWPSGWGQAGVGPPGQGQSGSFVPGFGRPTVRRVPAPYTGPPSYGPTHPNWGFPPIARIRPAVVEQQIPVPPGLRAAALLALTAALAAWAAAGAEGWRFALMLAGRTEVLSARTVAASTLTVTITAYLATALGILAILVVARAVAGYYRAAARRANLRPSRARLLARMLVPGWNLYAAGPVLIEAMRLGHAGYAAFRAEHVARGEVLAPVLPRRHRLLAGAWWAAWAVGGALVMATLVITVIQVRQPGTQLAADLVQLHLATDLAAALVGALTAAVLTALRRAWRGPRVRETDDWVVQSPRTSPPIAGADPEPPIAGADPEPPIAGADPAAGPGADPEPPIADLADAGADLGEHRGRQ